MHCHVENCKYPTTHITQGHKCIKCTKYGHGEKECKSTIKKMLLRDKFDCLVPFNKRCTYDNCKNRIYHTKEYHDIIHNLNKKYIIKCPICNMKNTYNSEQKKVYGIEEKCKICLTNTICIYLKNCGHTVMCEECFIILRTLTC